MRPFKNKFKKFIFISIITGAFTLSACGNKIDGNVIKLDSSGSLTQYITEEVQDPEGLSDFINSKVEAYNSKNNDALQIENEVKENDYKLELKYSTVKDFGKFNDYTVFNGSLGDATIEDFPIDNIDFYAVEKNKINKEDKVELSIINEHPEYHLLIIDSNIQRFSDANTENDENNEKDRTELNWIMFPGKIQYVSGNIIVSDKMKNTATVLNYKDEPGYIIYK